MNSSNNTEADPGLLPTSSTHPGSKPEPMSNDELSDSDVSFDEEDEDDELMHDTSGTYRTGAINHRGYYSKITFKPLMRLLFKRGYNSGNIFIGILSLKNPF